MRIKTLIIAVMCLAATMSLSAQRDFNRQGPLDPNSFTLLVIPDPQNYVKFDYNQPVFELMTAWTAHHVDTLNIKAVLCTGDLVDQNECVVPPFPRFGNLPSQAQWEYASHAFERLDNKVPYLIATGNHDYGQLRSENDLTRFPEFFPVTRNNKWNDVLVSGTYNRHGQATMENVAMEIDDPNWGKLLVITLEFAPRDEVLEWAKNLCASDRFKNHKAMIMTHAYMKGYSNERLDHHYKLQPANSGVQIWEKLVYPSENILFVLCGHDAKPNGRNDYTTGFRTDKNIAGRDVAQMMFNCQALGGGMSGNGGDGWIRLLEFMPDGETVSVRTYSPLFGFSDKTMDKAWRTESYDQFTFKLK